MCGDPVSCALLASLYGDNVTGKREVSRTTSIPESPLYDVHTTYLAPAFVSGLGLRVAVQHLLDSSWLTRRSRFTSGLYNTTCIRPQWSVVGAGDVHGSISCRQRLKYTVLLALFRCAIHLH